MSFDSKCVGKCLNGAQWQWGILGSHQRLGVEPAGRAGNIWVDLGLSAEKYDTIIVTPMGNVSFGIAWHICKDCGWIGYLCIFVVAVSQDLTGTFMFVSFSKLIYIHTHTSNNHTVVWFFGVISAKHPTVRMKWVDFCHKQGNHMVNFNMIEMGWKLYVKIYHVWLL